MHGNKLYGALMLYEKCEVCSKRKRTRKRKPYGLTGKASWCYGCDRNKVSEVNKGKERQKAKKETEAR